MNLVDFLRLTGANIFCDRSAVVGIVDVDPASVGNLSLDDFARVLEAGYPDLGGCLRACVDSADKILLVGNILSAVAAGLCNLLEETSRPIDAGRDTDTGNIFFGATCHDDRVAPRLTLAYDIVSDVVAALAGGRNAGRACQDRLETFKIHLESQTFGPTARTIVRSAEKRNIPWFPVTYGQDFQLAQFGWGAKARRMSGSRGPDTAFHACMLSFDKQATAKALARIGLPVPSQRIARNPKDARAAARDLGYPVVVKPRNLSHGRGISVGLTSEKAVRKAYAEAHRYGRQVLVETMLPGEDYRLLVVNGKLIAAARRVRASVVGDGRSTVRELVSELNRDPRRTGKFSLLDQVPLDDDVKRTLKSQKLRIGSIPEAGQIVYLRSVSGLHAGATAVDVTEQVHPDNRDAAERASLAIGLDIAGVDFIAPDIARSWRETGGGICEVNDLPGLRPHLVAESDALRDYGGIVLDSVFAQGDDGRIPVVLVVGDASDDIARDVARRLDDQAIGTALLERQGIFIRGRRIRDRSPNLAEDVGDCINDPWAEAAVLALLPGHVRSFGLGLDRATVSVLAGIDRVESRVIDLMVRSSEQVLFLVDGNLRDRLTRGDLAEGLGHAATVSLDASSSNAATAMLRDKNGNCSRLHVGETPTVPASTADLIGALSTAAADIAAGDHRNRQAFRFGFRSGRGNR